VRSKDNYKELDKMRPIVISFREEIHIIPLNCHKRKGYVILGSVSELREEIVKIQTVMIDLVQRIQVLERNAAIAEGEGEDQLYRSDEVVDRAFKSANGNSSSSGTNRNTIRKRKL